MSVLANLDPATRTAVVCEIARLLYDGAGAERLLQPDCARRIAEELDVPYVALRLAITEDFDLADIERFLEVTNPPSGRGASC